MDDMPRKLPQYVTKEKNRHGTWVYYFRKGKGKRTRLPAYGAEGFREEYDAALSGNVVKRETGHSPKSLGWLIDRHMESGYWAGLSDATRKQRGLIFKEVLEKSNPPFSDITKTTIEKSMQKRSATPAQANNFHKAMNNMFIWAVKNDHVKVNPCAGVDRLSYKTKGFIPWDESDVVQFCIKFPVGTIERLALELLLYSGLRRSDIVNAGKQHLKDNTFSMRTKKTGAQITVEFPQGLIDTIDATKTGDLAFITNAYGKPFTKESFGNWFGKKARAAGIFKNAHGVRKLSATTAANGGATTHELMAQYGWTNTKQAETYTKGADRVRLGIKSSRLVAEQMGDIIPRTSNPGAGKVAKSEDKSNTKK
jgi:integrase